MKHEKIGPQHLERKAILYVRQSSAHQVLHNRESSALQYAMRDRLSDLGWGRIETVDDDLGRSAAGGVAREGFDRMIVNLAYGGAYAYGKTQASPGFGTSAVRRKDREEWLALKPGVHEGYVSWERAEAIRKMVSNNVPQSRHRRAGSTPLA